MIQQQLLYSDGGGSIEYTWTAPNPGSTNLLGTVHISMQSTGHADVEMDVPAFMQPVGSSLLLGQVVPANGAFQLQFTSDGTPVNVQVKPHLVGRAFALDISSDKGLISAVVRSDWPTTAGPQDVAVPYYSGAVMYLKQFDCFINSYFDWRVSQATKLMDSQALYNPTTSGARNPVQESLILNMSANVVDVFPTIGNPSSPYLAQLAGRPILDIWSGSFSQTSRALTLLGNYGLRNCVALIHVWQRSGYDNALPAQYPANANMGGNAGLQQAIGSAQQSGCYAGVHENYVDYYPNYDLFTTSAIARDSQNGLQLSAFNATTNIQSFATRPNLFVANAATQSPEIHAAFNTTASFLDVNSSVEPWWRSDMDSSMQGAGTFGPFRTANPSLWAYLRQTHTGPVFGEGTNHWFWSGLLDGVEAPFGAGQVPSYLSTNAPLFVDFDLLKIHPLQVNHGMGYYSRWLASGQDITTRTDLLDAYRMQEVIYGHAPFLGDTLWSIPARTLLEQNLVSPVASRYGTANASSIQYQVAGNWTDTNTAVKAGDWSRVKVQYSNGDSIVVNGQAQTLSSNGLTLPQFGWVASGSNLLAYTALQNGIIADYAAITSSYFANARNAADLQASGSVAQPQAVSFQQTGKGTAQIRVQWRVLDGNVSENLNNFVHFLSSSGAIAFAADHSPSVPTSSWTPGQAVQDSFNFTVPANVADGIYSLRMGLCSMQTGDRFPLLGSVDDQLRYLLGTLTVSGGGTTLTFQIAAPLAPLADSRLNLSGSKVDFGTIRTDGMVSLIESGTNWVMHVYPEWRNVTLELNANTFNPAGMICETGSAKPTLSNGYWLIQTFGVKKCQFPVTSQPVQPPPPPTEPIANGTYIMTSACSLLVLDNPGFSTWSGTPIIQYAAKSSNNANQQWTFVYSSSAAAYTIQNAYSGLFLTDQNGQLIEAKAVSGSSTQLWNLTATNGGFVITNAGTGKVIDDPGLSLLPHTQIITWSPNGGVNQIWRVTP